MERRVGLFALDFVPRPATHNLGATFAFCAYFKTLAGL